MAFVEMENTGSMAEFSEQPHAADSQQHLLDDARLAVAAIQVARNPAISFLVCGNVCVEQIERHATDVGSPNLGPHCALANQTSTSNGVPSSVFTGCNGNCVGISLTIKLFLPAHRIETLAKITVVIEQAHRHERQARSLADLR